MLIFLIYAVFNERRSLYMNHPETYSLILVSRGGCSPFTAADILQNTLGYTENEALSLTAVTPVRIAVSLDEEQTETLCRIFSEAGMDIEVHDINENEIHIQEDRRSVYDENGDLNGDTAKVLDTFGQKCRVKACQRFEKRAFLETWKNNPMVPVSSHHLS
jgi:hypothetical protein